MFYIHTIKHGTHISICSSHINLQTKLTFTIPIHQIPPPKIPNYPIPVPHIQHRHTHFPHKQGQPIIICEQEDDATIQMGQKILQIPHSVDCLQGILTIIPMQLLSLHVAELRKLDVSHSSSCYTSGSCCMMVTRLGRHFHIVQLWWCDKVAVLLVRDMSLDVCSAHN